MDKKIKYLSTVVAFVGAISIANAMKVIIIQNIGGILETLHQHTGVRLIVNLRCVERVNSSHQ